MDSNLILQVENLTVSFNTQRGLAKAVNNVNFELHKGEILGIVGESGCGKSVTSKSILKILPSRIARIEGHIFYNNVDLLSLNEEKMERIRGNRISMIFQEPMVSLDPLFSIGEQLREVLQTHAGLNKNEANQKVISVLKEVGIPSPEVRIKQYPFELSGGMRQRVMIAMGILLHPDILIADEPTTALDVTIQAQILQLLKNINQKYGTSIILITHDLGIISEFADQVAVMYAGKIVEKASSFEIFRNPLHPYTQGLMDSIPTMERLEGDLPSIPGIVPSIYNLPKGCAFCGRCPYAMNICGQKDAPEQTCSSRMVKCWKYRKEPLS